MWWQAVTGDADWAGLLVPHCGNETPTPAHVGWFEVMLLLPHFLSTQAPFVKRRSCDFARRGL